MAQEFPVVIHHNPNCGTSRNTLEMIRQSGRQPVVNEYLKTGWTRAKLKQLLTAIQTDRKWLAVRQINLNRDQDLPGSVQVSLTLVTYFLGEESEPKRASLPAGGAP